MDSIRECSIDGCVRASRARGCCEMHYRRLAARGTTETPRRSTVAERLAANTRRSEGCWEWLGAKTSAGYPEDVRTVLAALRAAGVVTQEGEPNRA